MKTLVENLEWIRLGLLELPDGLTKTAALDSWIECNAIAQALPEIPVYVDGVQIKSERRPPKPIIERPRQ